MRISSVVTMVKSTVLAVFTTLVLQITVLVLPSNLADATTTTPDTPEIITLVVKPTTAAPVDIVPDIVITLVFIGACAMMGIGIAKCADFVYDKHVAHFSKKEVSENTRKLLRARVAIMRMKVDPKTTELKFAKRAAAQWMSKTAGKKEDVVATNNEIGKTHVPGIQIEDAVDVEQGKSEHNPESSGEKKTLATTKDESKPQELHPVERINITIKPGGPLPPVVVNDTPSPKI